jgi:uncharacterized YigZ family protein
MTQQPSYYRTVRAQGEAEIVVKRSRFIGHAKRVETEAEAVAFIEAIRSRHKQATHHCYAYVTVTDGSVPCQKASDDGEPSGTAGKPILDVIRHQQLEHVAIVVTRYYGGTMLGAGGLIRAYTEGATVGLAAAGVVFCVLHVPLTVTVDYSWFGKLENELRAQAIMFDQVEFTNQVTLRCLPLAAEAERVRLWLTDLTAAQAQIEVMSALYLEMTQFHGGERITYEQTE